MPTIRFKVFNVAYRTEEDDYTRGECSSAWDVLQLLNRHVRTSPLSTTYANGQAIADPGVAWARNRPNRLLILPKHSEDMEEMEAFAVELWELACRITQEKEPCSK